MTAISFSCFQAFPVRLRVKAVAKVNPVLMDSRVLGCSTYSRAPNRAALR